LVISRVKHIILTSEVEILTNQSLQIETNQYWSSSNWLIFECKKDLFYFTLHTKKQFCWNKNSGRYRSENNFLGPLNNFLGNFLDMIFSIRANFILKSKISHS